jgi:hypothetical protein
MMETGKKEIAVKHREDVIDTLVLRAKERRVLFSLLLVLLITIGYENSSYIFSGLYGENYVAPALGTRQKNGVRKDMFLHLGRMLPKVIDEFPQFCAHLERQQRELNQLLTLIDEKNVSEDSIMKQVQLVLRGLQEFNNHPAVNRSKSVEALAKELQQLARLTKISLPAELEIKPLDFSSRSNMAEVAGGRNLFEYR